jgi:homoserine kinase
MTQPRVRVRVPASTSNLGPGFDALGLALDLAVTVEATVADKLCITISGEGLEQIPCGSDNLVYRRMATLAQQYGMQLPPLRLHIHNEIPLERGLGASGVASIAGLLAADALLQTKLEQAQILDLAYQLEGHPDNVTPSLLGGCTVSAVANGHVTALHVPFSDELVCALCIPNVHMPTQAARQIIPYTYPRADVVFNLSRAALFVTALATRRYDALRIAVEDKLHQPYRARVFPALPAIINAAYDMGAYGAFLSGAGSTVAAFTTPLQADAVAQSMKQTGERHNLVCRALVAHIDRVGAVVSE